MLIPVIWPTKSNASLAMPAQGELSATPRGADTGASGRGRQSFAAFIENLRHLTQHKGRPDVADADPAEMPAEAVDVSDADEDAGQVISGQEAGEESEPSPLEASELTAVQDGSDAPDLGRGHWAPVGTECGSLTEVEPLSEPAPHSDRGLDDRSIDDDLIVDLTTAELLPQHLVTGQTGPVDGYEDAAKPLGNAPEIASSHQKIEAHAAAVMVPALSAPDDGLNASNSDVQSGASWSSDPIALRAPAQWGLSRAQASSPYVDATLHQDPSVAVIPRNQSERLGAEWATVATGGADMPLHASASEVPVSGESARREGRVRPFLAMGKNEREAIVGGDAVVRGEQPQALVGPGRDGAIKAVFPSADPPDRSPTPVPGSDNGSVEQEQRGIRADVPVQVASDSSLARLRHGPPKTQSRAEATRLPPSNMDQEPARAGSGVELTMAKRARNVDELPTILGAERPRIPAALGHQDASVAAEKPSPQADRIGRLLGEPSVAIAGSSKSQGRLHGPVPVLGRGAPVDVASRKSLVTGVGDAPMGPGHAMVEAEHRSEQVGRNPSFQRTAVFPSQRSVMGDDILARARSSNVDGSAKASDERAINSEAGTAVGREGRTRLAGETGQPWAAKGVPLPAYPNRYRVPEAIAEVTSFSGREPSEPRKHATKADLNAVRAAQIVPELRSNAAQHGAFQSVTPMGLGHPPESLSDAEQYLPTRATAPIGAVRSAAAPDAAFGRMISPIAVDGARAGESERHAPDHAEQLVAESRGETISRADPSSTRPAGVEVIRHVSGQIAGAIGERLVPASAPEAGFDLSLDPEELGHVRLKLVNQPAGATLIVQAERPETLDLLRRHIATLQDDLRGLGHGELTLSFSGGESQGRQNAWTGAAASLRAVADDRPAGAVQAQTSARVDLAQRQAVRVLDRLDLRV